jgi:hypothetical protein
MSSSSLSMRTTNCVTQQSAECFPNLKVTNDVGFIVPRAEVVSYSNVIKAVSIPPIVTGAIPITVTKGIENPPGPPPSVDTPATIISQVQKICVFCFLHLLEIHRKVMHSFHLLKINNHYDSHKNQISESAG